MTINPFARVNPILRTDSYKTSHYLQYPPGTTNVSSYIEARVGGFHEQVTFFGLQAFVFDKLLNPERRITIKDVLDAEAFCEKHGVPFNKEGFMKIANVYGGYWPVEIEAIPEGTVVPEGTCLIQIRNLGGEDMAWATSFIETQLLRATWYPVTVATNSRAIKRNIYDWLKLTSDDPVNQIAFKLHDFGARGASSEESASIGGAAHLLNFMGSDTMEGIEFASRFYGADMAAFSIPAAEHSTITSWGMKREAQAYRNMIEKFDGEGKIFAVVSDSYDIQNAVEKVWGETLKSKVEGLRGTLVIRPDSGDPVTMTLNVIKSLEAKFGTTTNGMGFKVLPKYLRIIQGDGVNQTSIDRILSTYHDNGYSADNIAFGMGGALLQKVTRDDQRFAMKQNAISYNNGESWEAVQKVVKSDPSKASKAGVQRTVKYPNGRIATVCTQTPVRDGTIDLMRPVYRTGEILVQEEWNTIVGRANEWMKN